MCKTVRAYNLRSLASYFQSKYLILLIGILIGATVGLGLAKIQENKYYEVEMIIQMPGLATNRDYRTILYKVKHQLIEQTKSGLLIESDISVKAQKIPDTNLLQLKLRSNSENSLSMAVPAYKQNITEEIVKMMRERFYRLNLSQNQTLKEELTRDSQVLISPIIYITQDHALLFYEQNYLNWGISGIFIGLWFGALYIFYSYKRILIMRMGKELNNGSA